MREAGPCQGGQGALARRLAFFLRLVSGRLCAERPDPAPAGLQQGGTELRQRLVVERLRPRRADRLLGLIRIDAAAGQMGRDRTPRAPPRERARARPSAKMASSSAPSRTMSATTLRTRPRASSSAFLTRSGSSPSSSARRAHRAIRRCNTRTKPTSVVAKRARCAKAASRRAVPVGGDPAAGRPSPVTRDLPGSPPSRSCCPEQQLPRTASARHQRGQNGMV